VAVLELLPRLTYFLMEASIIGGVAAVVWLFHIRFLWGQRKPILLGTLLVSAYALPLDAIAVARGWGGFNPAYVSGVYFFGGALLLEEVFFWLGTSFVIISAVLIFAELERRGAPWWALPAAILLPLEFFDGFYQPEAAADLPEISHVRQT
jgi:lycopene cyclase domain-containing protein